jgi:hypothetical protein
MVKYKDCLLLETAMDFMTPIRIEQVRGDPVFNAVIPEICFQNTSFGRVAESCNEFAQVVVRVTKMIKARMNAGDRIFNVKYKIVKIGNARKASLLVLSLSLAIVFTGCLKSVDPPKAEPAKAYVSIMYLAPTGPALDVYFDSKRVSNTSFAPGNVTVAYNAVDRGTFSVVFKKASSDSVVASVTPALYDSLNFYTIFLHNVQANGPVSAVRIKDDFTVLTPGTAYIRFFHASPDTDPVDFYIDNMKVESGRAQADNIPSGNYNNFSSLAPGVHTFQVKEAGTDNVLATLNHTDLLAGNAYTFYLRGLKDGTGTNQLSLAVLRAIN